jgi:uncharacterized protein (TIGR03437 family)
MTPVRQPIGWLAIFAIVLVATAAAQPQIAANGVVNAASNALVPWPNSFIAQGSIFTIYGTDLGPSSSPALAYPLETTLGGVSVQISSGGTALNAIPIFVGPNQINAILPGSTPTSPAATLRVTYNGQTSNTVSFQVIAHSFGIFTVNSASIGAGIITGANRQLYSVHSPANPGAAATIWGTGIGASPADDGAAPPQQIDMPNLPLSIYVGTQLAAVTYRGRASFTGEDQINFVVPSGITDCNVPVAVQIGNVVSNFATMPIAPAGQSCPDPAPPVPTLANPSSALTGNITLTRTTLIGTTTSTTDYGQAFFGDPQVNAFPYVPPFFGNPYSVPAGTCIGSVTFPPLIDTLEGPMDVGPITINGPNGSQQLPTFPSFSPAQLGGGSGANAQPLFLSAGDYTASATAGTEVYGAVGAFSQNFTIPQLLTWTNQGSISTVDRSAGLDVTWAGGDPDGTVQITGDVAFICNAKISDQHFTIPAFVLLSYPAAISPAGNLTLGTVSTTAFTASGISSGTINSVVLFVKSVTYQ